MEFQVRADYYLLHKARTLCEEMGLDFNGLKERAALEAALEFDRRQTMPENGYSHKWGFYHTKIRTENPILSRVANAFWGRFTRISYDVAFNRHLERILCEERLRRSR